MTDSSLIPGIVDEIVKEEIIPLLPWHTRPILLALSRAWRNSLDAIGVQGGERLDPNYGSSNRLDPIYGEPIARLTRLKQPLKCHLAVEYYHTYLDRENSLFKPGHLVKLFDGQWRNIAPITGRGPYTYTNFFEGFFFNGATLGVVDGTLYYVERETSLVTATRIFSLDIGSGLWQWQVPYERENYGAVLEYICRTGRFSDGHFVCHKKIGSHFEISELPAWLQITDRAPANVDHDLVNFSPRPKLVHVEKEHTLFFFGMFSDTQNVVCLDLNTRTWHNSRVDADTGGTLKVLKNVLLVAYDGTHFHILRYNSISLHWKRAGRMLSPSDNIWKWTWCIEYDREGEKQLWIYICLQDFSLYKWQVVQKLVGGITIAKVWDDVVLPGREVECELVNCTPLDQPFDPLEPFNDENAPTLSVHALHGFHRSDSPNFEDTPDHLV